ncbi:aminoacyl-tRNA hydrolase [Candidatus Parabeggiatoa sp. HSG14]|uniref:aminoacyl-tRNA hydrolase n=1 Tax=Candidatus Parabeggiatoa sp. HSG14 TaxID=3055593 RepID=UPI0025A6958A|nr:aminoacyl-tRNA hydrolase [Thiotrichales bacterium HSG14]
MSITLIVGLGNPGPQYIATRHNAGFWLLDNIAVPANAQFRRETKFFGEVCRVEMSFPSGGGNLCWLLKPTTFMNRSGQSVIALANYYKIPAEQILVVHDDLDFPPGTARLKQGGSDGRHNGLKDIIAHLGTNQFLRLRLGIGHPGRSGDVTNYVLGSPSRDDQEAIESSMNAALEVMPLIVTGEINKATQQLHTHT